MQSVLITANVVSTNHTRAIQHYVIKFVSDLRQVGGFLRFPPPHHDITEIVLKVAFNTINLESNLPKSKHAALSMVMPLGFRQIMGTENDHLINNMRIEKDGNIAE